MHLLRELLRREGGAVAMIFAFATPLALGGTMMAVDVTALVKARSHLQGIADSSALAGAKGLHVYRDDHSAMQEGVRQQALAMMTEGGMADASPTADVLVDPKAASVKVTVGIAADTLILGKLGYADRVSATAEAHAFGSARLCVLALDQSDGEAIRAKRIASIDAAECAVQSNSPAEDAIKVDALSSIDALGICSSGGVDGPKSAFAPEPDTDCPKIDDPLAGQAMPAAGPCTYTNKNIILPAKIKPGHYCGGLTLGPTALVTAEPGDYVFSGGPLKLGAASSLIGENVSFRFTDKKSTFSFGLGSIVQLSAPTDGPMAGFLFYQDAGIAKGGNFLIATDLATKLLGTIYLPSGTLKIDVIGLVAAQSAYTVVVADRIDIKGADLVINSDYGATDVPVPAGVGPNGGQVLLDK